MWNEQAFHWLDRCLHRGLRLRSPGAPHYAATRRRRGDPDLQCAFVPYRESAWTVKRFAANRMNRMLIGSPVRLCAHGTAPYFTLESTLVKISITQAASKHCSLEHAAYCAM